MKTKRLKIEFRNRGITRVPVKRNTISDRGFCSCDFFLLSDRQVPLGYRYFTATVQGRYNIRAERAY